MKRKKEKRISKLIQIIILLTEIRDYLKRLDKCVSYSGSLKTHSSPYKSE